MAGSSEVIERSVMLPVGAEEAFAWHERPGALERLIPPWERVEVLERSDGITDGDRVVVRIHEGPIALRWVARHRDALMGLTPFVALVCFFPITANALDGFASAPAELRSTMRTLNATPRAIFWRVELPWATPRVFTGARIAASYAAVAALFAEYAGGSGGLADSMHDQLDTQLVGAAILLLALLALALFGLVTLIERVVIPWAREG